MERPEPESSLQDSGQPSQGTAFTGPPPASGLYFDGTPESPSPMKFFSLCSAVDTAALAFGSDFFS